MPRITTISISILIVFVVGFFFTWPQYQNLRNITAEVREKKVELQYKEEYFSNLRKTSEELKNYESEISKIDSVLPSGLFLPSLFNFLDKTASQNGLILKQVGKFSVISSKEKPERIKEIHLEITISGSYPAFKNFLSALEKTARFVEAENIVFSFPKSEEEHFSFDLKIKAYSY